MPHLSRCWPQVARRIRAAERVVLFLDFDGTLTRLRRRPEDVPRLDLVTRRLLGRLARRRRVDVYVISGRRLADLRSLVQVPGVRLLGLHGWEGRGVSSLPEERRLIREARRWLADRLPKTEGIRLEDKGLGLAVHYRGARASEVRAARPVVRRALEQFKPRLRILKGKKIWELLPSAMDGKGPAVIRVLAGLPGPALAILAGDDTTDESAFAALRRGITLRVGSRRTRARFYVRNPGEVVAFLRRWEAEIA